jgi:ketosteroid isomerase-like protein
VVGDEKARVMREFYEATSRGDLETVDKLLAPNFVWHIPGNSPVAGITRGSKALRR